MKPFSHIEPWKDVLRQNFTKVRDVADFLELSEEACREIDFSPRFPFQLPRRLGAKIEKKTLNDPLFKQFIPLKKEKEAHENFVLDPVDDKSFKKEKKLLHKYQRRALIVSTSACAMHCRYCFRQNFDYDTSNLSFAKELEYLRDNPSIEEVILSGGDPLSLHDHTLKTLFDKIALLSHVKLLRFHTRFPIGIPERIDESFLQLLKSFPKQIWFIIHCNHPRELDADIFSSLKEIQKLGIPVLNQSVLLKGVNDSADTLEELFITLASHGISPYYLHQLDPVVGTAHFYVPESTGLHLMAEVQKRLPGYALPKYVQEVPGKPSKIILA